MATIRRGHWAVAVLVAGSLSLGWIGDWGGLHAQPPAKGKAAVKRPVAKGKAGAGRRKTAADPLAAPAREAGILGDRADAAPGTYHFRLKIQAFDDAPLAASYYPSKNQDTKAPVVLLVHEKARTGKDFEDPIADLKKQGFADYLQFEGYAVLAFDLRGHGDNGPKTLSERQWKAMVDDLQAVYQFLVDRHNRGELNLAKLGVVAVGEGANLAAAWAYQPGGAVSSEGRVTDVSGMALISPLASGEGYEFSTLMNSLAPRVRILLAAGERDAASHDTVKSVRARVERSRENKVEVFPSSLHAYKLLLLEPKAATSVMNFLGATVKLRATEWEPRYNLTPVSYSDIRVIRHAKKEKEAEKPKAKEAEKPREKEAEKAPEKAKDDGKGR